MTDAILPILRCPIDPARQSPLEREDQHLVCSCGVRFPIRNGLPILVPDQADLPDGCPKTDTLPCRRKRR